MAGRLVLYDHAAKVLTDGTISFLSDDLYVAMMTSSFSTSASHTVWANVSATEVAAGNGYTAGGELVSGKVITNSGMDAILEFPEITKDFRALVIYKLGTANGLVNPLLGYIDFTTTISLTASEFAALFYTVMIPLTTNRWT